MTVIVAVPALFAVIWPLEFTLKTLKAETKYLLIFSFLFLIKALDSLAIFSTFLEEKISVKMFLLNENMFDWLGRIKDNDIASFPYCNFGFFDLIIMPITLRN